VKNHVLGVYTGSEEGPANLGLTRDAIQRLRNDETTDSATIQDVITESAHDPEIVGDHLRHAFEDRVKAERGGLDIERVPDETVDELTAAATGGDLTEVLEAQREASRAFRDQAEEE
jgi:CRISPR-associated protein Csc2